MLSDGKTGEDKDGNNVFGTDSLAARFDAAARPVITVDVTKYQSWLDESGLSEEKKAEFLQALWSIVVAFVELGFGVHPLQDVCERNTGTVLPRPKESFDPAASRRSDEAENIEYSGSLRGREVE